jgi:hypothetical protein
MSILTSSGLSHGGAWSDGPTLHAELLPALPKLAWVATIDGRREAAHVLHGSAVETGRDFLVEGVWDGPFGNRDFHRAEHFYGSGIRIEGSEIWLVPSRTTVDRIVYCRQGDDVMASNSLALLLGFTGARLDPHHNYRREGRAILGGVKSYDPRFVVAHPTIDGFMQVYYEPIVVSTAGIERRAVEPPRRLTSFEEYRALLDEGLRRIQTNARDSTRRRPMSLFSTISSGYDSAAVTTLVHQLGLQAAFTSRRSNGALVRLRPSARDDGARVARHLGVPLRYLDPDPRGVSREELYFLAASTGEPELAFHPMTRWIEEHSTPAVVFTGHPGGSVWDVNIDAGRLTGELKRKDTSGLGLSEIRLKAGFVNAAVPHMFGRSNADLVAIGRSPDMAPWRLGDDYDRPVPRRIIESAGVPRGAFANRKRAVVRHYCYPVSRELRPAFMAHLRGRYGLRPARVYLHAGVSRISYLAQRVFDRICHPLGKRKARSPRALVKRHVDLFYELHVWALEELARDLGNVVRRRQP